MKKLTLLLMAAVAQGAATVCAQDPTSDASLVPERVVVVSGDPSMVRQNVVAVLYDSNDFHFHDPSAPRFLFLDRQGKIAFGIGGYVYATAAYNFAGSEDCGSDFIPSALAAPGDAARRAALQFTAQHSSIFMQLVGHSERFGTYSAYVQTNFTGGDRVLKLNQAYFKVGYVTMGLARSTFVDASDVATVDTQGPCGALDSKNVLVQYAPDLGRGWRVGIGVEAPPVGATQGAMTQEIAQRVPDIPAYVEYGWGKSNHVRASAIVRNMCYRDKLASRHRYATGYGVQLSGESALGAGFTFYGDFTFGRGIGSYVADMKDLNLDLVPSATAGRLDAPRTFSYALGLQYDFCKKGFATLAWGQARLYDRGALDGDTYRYGTYMSANVFYELFPDCLLGLEYARGERKNFSGERGSGNRIMAAVRYSF